MTLKEAVELLEKTIEAKEDYLTDNLVEFKVSDLKSILEHLSDYWWQQLADEY